MKSISFIGCGNMGSAIAGALKDYQVVLYDADENVSKKLGDKIGASVAPSLEEALSSSILLLAVKPQVLPSLYPVLKTAGDKDFISIAAGTPLEVLKKNIGAKNIARFMPNLAARAKMAITAVAILEDADKAFRDEAIAIASSFGSAVMLDEKLFPAFTGESGSGIAYALEFMHAMAMGGVKCGISYPTAVKIAKDTMLSACALLATEDENPVSLLAKVCSPAGTTIEGMEALYELGFDDSVIKAVTKACEKSINLEKSAKERG